MLFVIDFDSFSGFILCFNTPGFYANLHIIIGNRDISIFNKSF